MYIQDGGYLEPHNIVNTDHLRHLYGETLAYTPIVGELYIWLSGFAAFAFLMTLAREMVKDIEDIEGDREMECRTLPIVWGEKWTKIIVTALVGILFSFTASLPVGLACVGAGIFASGLAIFLFFGCQAATRGILLFTRQLGIWTKRLFLKKEKA